MSGPAPRLRVVHVIDSLAGSGGAENRLVDEVLAMRRRCDQRVVRLFERHALEDRLVGGGVPVTALGFRAAHAGRSWPAAARRLVAMLAAEPPDVLHTSLFTGNLVGQLAGARLGIPVVSTFNRTGDVALQRRLQPGVASWRGRALQAVGRRAARCGDVHYRAVGRYAGATNCAALRLPPGRCTVVPRGVGVDPPPARRRADLGLPEGVPLFVNVARLVPEKAQHLLVRAFARVRSVLPDAHLAVVGAPGSASGAVAEAGRGAGVEGAVSLLGFRPDARQVVAAADVFAFSSVSEGSPGAVVEALALGMPVAAFGIPPVAELTDGGAHAWLAPPLDVGALAEAMLGAWRATGDEARRAATRSWAADRYALDAVAARLADLLEHRARGGGPRPRRRPRWSATSTTGGGPG
ncbi:MAG TPA: glycosyltransferase [Acidimicrobiales bacterium]|nr:glycosyltransferase [Acidimicrobiales bacterium]